MFGDLRCGALSLDGNCRSGKSARMDRCAGCGFEYDLDDAPEAGLDIIAGAAEIGASS